MVLLIGNFSTECFDKNKELSRTLVTEKKEVSKEQQIIISNDS